MSGEPGSASPATGLHRSVLVEEVVSFLSPCPPEAWIVDGTVGLGGHAARLLEESAASRLLGLDRDATTLELAAERLRPFGDRVTLRPADFRQLSAEAAAAGVSQAHAVLLDLGLSSFQLDHSGRGFSFLRDEPLDMRFDRRQPLTAAALLNRTPEGELARVLADYGEEPAARRIARRIVAARARQPLRTTRDLADLVAGAIPPARRIPGRHPATRTFQAVRIAVNDELAGLADALPQAARLLAPRGRVGVIAFHSVEDRLVKQAFRGLAREGWRMVTPKPIRPSASEVHDNPRARSAMLRVLERN